LITEGSGKLASVPSGGSGGGGAAASGGAAAGGAAAAEEKAEEKEEGISCLTILVIRLKLTILQKRKSPTRIWASVSSIRVSIDMVLLSIARVWAGHLEGVIRAQPICIS
jgi:hypothetical protein